MELDSYGGLYQANTLGIQDAATMCSKGKSEVLQRSLSSAYLHNRGCVGNSIKRKYLDNYKETFNPDPEHSIFNIWRGVLGP